MLSVNVGADQHLTAVEVFRQPPCGFMGLPGIDGFALRKALHHVVELDAAAFVVQQFRTEKFVERRFRLTADAADECLTIPERLIFLCHIPHYTFHAAACLCAFLVVHEMDDCDLPEPPSCNSRRVVLILANSCTAEFRFAN